LLNRQAGGFDFSNDRNIDVSTHVDERGLVVLVVAEFVYTHRSDHDLIVWP
jgi:hypothetical protein